MIYYDFKEMSDDNLNHIIREKEQEVEELADQSRNVQDELYILKREQELRKNRIK